MMFSHREDVSLAKYATAELAYLIEPDGRAPIRTAGLMSVAGRAVGGVDETKWLKEIYAAGKAWYERTEPPSSVPVIAAIRNF